MTDQRRAGQMTDHEIARMLESDARTGRNTPRAVLAEAGIRLRSRANAPAPLQSSRRSYAVVARGSFGGSR